MYSNIMTVRSIKDLRNFVAFLKFLATIVTNGILKLKSAKKKIVVQSFTSNLNFRANI